MRDALERIKLAHNLAIPKDAHGLEDVRSVFGSIAGETDSSWLVGCSHAFRPPADAGQIEDAETALGHVLPQAYKQFLAMSNGAELFVVPRRGLHWSGSIVPHVRFRLFGCLDLSETNRSLLKTFRQAYADDPEFREIDGLNYMAFCDAQDGNLQAILLDDTKDERVFLLFHELFYRPYSDLETDFYYTIAPSLESWFDLIVRSDGWEGRGPLRSGL